MLNFRTRFFYQFMDKAIDPENPNPAGGGGNPSKDDPEKSKTVTREYLNKVLNEKKNLKSRFDTQETELETLRAKETERLEADKLKKGEHEQIITTRDARIAELEKDKSDRDVLDAEQTKFNAFMGGLDTNLDRIYWKLVDTSGITLDENGNADPVSLKKVVDGFKDEYKSLLNPINPKLPNGAPHGGKGNGILYADWKNLPTSKEMKERQKDITDI